MKKLSFLISALLIFTLVFIPSATAASFSDGAEYPAYISGTDNWKPVYIANSSYTVSGISDASVAMLEGLTMAIVTGATGTDAYATLYFHQGDANRIVSTGDNYDIGFCFTAPLTSQYKFAAKESRSTYDGTDNADGVKMTVYDKDMAVLKSHTFINDSALITQTVSLDKGEKIYVMFNRNNTVWNDKLYLEYVKMILQTSSLSESEFPKADTNGIPVMAGSDFSQFFNCDNTPGVKALWKPFFVDDVNQIKPLVKKAGEASFTLPDEYKKGNDMYALIWDGLKNVVMPGETRIVGDYFTCPASGKVTVSALMSYMTDPGSNPPSADGIGVIAYKNAISESSIVIPHTLVTYQNSGENGLLLEKKNVSVDKGDVIIFVYDKNGTIYSDSTKVVEKSVRYTSVNSPSSVLSPDAKNAKLSGNVVEVLDTLTIQQALDGMGISLPMYAVFDADGNQIGDFSKPATEAVALKLYTQNNFYLVGEYQIKAVKVFGAASYDSPETSDTVFLFMVAVLLSVVLAAVCIKRLYSRT